MTLDIPVLWSNIEIREGVSLEVFTLYLKRSAKAPLSLALVSNYQVDFMPFLGLLQPHIGRLRSLRAFLTQQDDFLHFAQIFGPVNAPILRELDIDFCTGEMYRDNLFKLFEHGTPSLETLRLESAFPPELSFPYSPLKRLSLSGMESWRYYKMIRRDHPLTHLVLDAWCMPDWSLFPGFEFRKLRSLEIGGGYIGYDDGITGLFRVIRAPRLEEIILVDTAKQGHAFSELQADLPCFPMAQLLKMIEVDVQQNAYTILSRIFPSVTHIDLAVSDGLDWLDRGSSARNILNELSTPSLNLPWPHLKTLTLTPVDTALLRACISAREKMGKPLLRVAIQKWQQHGPIEVKDVDLRRLLREE